MKFRPEFNRLVSAVRRALSEERITRDKVNEILRHALAIEIEYQLTKLLDKETAVHDS
jgi:hypothetical protein